ncbi:MAG: ParB N-terminal domain-containing protein, partial [Anaerolineales bacterium]
MNNPSSLRYTYAIQDFREARRKAAVQQVLARITGKSIDLLPFEEVRKKLKGNQKINRGLQEIPLDAIIGSVGRYADFTRSFLPRQDRDVDRWVKVKVQVAEKGWLPPIEVYQIGEAYFVLDGNHRVSIARTTGVPTIQAYVTEIRTKVPLSPDDQPDDLILKAELADFLDYTELNPAHADLRVTAPGNYRFLLRQITGIQRKRREEHGEKLSGDKASLTWFEKNYLPVVRIIRERGLLRDFPNRTETDLYVWMNKHRAKLEKTIGWEIEWEKAAYNLVSQASTKPKRVAARIGGKLYDALTPDPLESGPRPGQWRQDMLATHRKNRLFTGILVPVSGEEPGWLALEQALVLAKLEGDHLHGLHVVPTGEPRNSPRALGVKAEFER